MSGGSGRSLTLRYIPDHAAQHVDGGDIGMAGTFFDFVTQVQMVGAENEILDGRIVLGALDQMVNLAIVILNKGSILAGPVSTYIPVGCEDQNLRVGLHLPEEAEYPKRLECFSHANLVRE